MEKREIKLIETNTIIDIICDSCGDSCKKDIDYEYMKLEANFGYDSNKDGQRYEAHLCEKCVDEKLNFINFNKTKWFI